MQRYFETLRDTFGNRAAGVAVYVRVSGAGTMATIYDASENLENPVTTIPNPLVSDANGEIAFAATDGYYDLEYSGSNVPSGTHRYVALVSAAPTVDASNVIFTPYGNIAATNVQDAIEELDDEVVHKAGTETITGDKTFTGLANVNSLNFDTTPSGVASVDGLVVWDTDRNTVLETVDATAGTTLGLGLDLATRVVNKTGVTLTKGQCVYVSGAQGNRPTATLAKADAHTTTHIIGIVINDIANNAEGYVMVHGVVKGINTTGWLAGDPLYLSAATAGLLTNTAPTSPNFLVQTAYALNSTANGSIYVNPEQSLAMDNTMASASDFTAPSQKAVKDYVTTAISGFGPGTVTNVSVVNANGFDGTVANATTTPAITMKTTVTGMLKGNGTAISAATAGTDYVAGGTGSNTQVAYFTASGVLAGNANFVYTPGTKVAINETTASSSTATGALTVAGGVGVAGQTTTKTAAVLDTVQVTSFTGTASSPLSVKSTTASGDYSSIGFISSGGVNGAKIAYLQTASGGNLVFGTTNNFGSGITNTAITINHVGDTNISSTTASTSTTTGALTVGGGIGALGNAVISGVFVSANAAGVTRGLYMNTSTTSRWGFLCNNTAESGGNAGSNFDLEAYTDAAALIDRPIQISRANGGTITLGGTTNRTVAMTWSATVANALTVTSTITGQSTTDSTSTGTGGLILSGGLGLAKNITSGGSIKSVSATLGIGYGTGAGGTVTQATNKSTGVTLNTVTGAITMNGAALAAATIVSFTLTNSAIAATDLLVLNHVTTGTRGGYTLNADCAAGSAVIYVRNNTAGSLSEAIVIRFAVIKGVTS